MEIIFEIVLGLIAFGALVDAGYTYGRIRGRREGATGTRAAFLHAGYIQAELRTYQRQAPDNYSLYLH